MILVNPPHRHFSPKHLDHVMREMLRRGPPVLRAHFDGEVWHAREGTHRLRAAKALGIAPVLIAVPWPRSRAALERARMLVADAAHSFDHVKVIILTGESQKRS